MSGHPVPSPFITPEELVKRDIETVDRLVARIAPSLAKIVAIVKRNGVNQFSIHVPDEKGVKTHFIMSDEDSV